MMYYSRSGKGLCLWSMSAACPAYAPFFGFAGVTASMVLSAAGAAYGTAKAGATIAAAGVFGPNIIMTALLPVIMAGILAIYGLVVSVFISTSLDPSAGYPLFTGALHLGAGLAVGCCGLASGVSIGLIGDAGVRGYLKQPRLFLGLVLMLIFAEVLGLYGLLTAVVMHTKARSASC